MTTKNYEKRCARLVQETCVGAKLSYQTALRWVRQDQEAHPEEASVQTRALRIYENKLAR